MAITFNQKKDQNQIDADFIKSYKAPEDGGLLYESFHFNEEARKAKANVREVHVNDSGENSSYTGINESRNIRLYWDNRTEPRLTYHTNDNGNRVRHDNWSREDKKTDLYAIVIREAELNGLNSALAQEKEKERSHYPSNQARFDEKTQQALEKGVFPPEIRKELNLEPVARTSILGPIGDPQAEQKKKEIADAINLHYENLQHELLRYESKNDIKRIPFTEITRSELEAFEQKMIAEQQAIQAQEFSQRQADERAKHIEAAKKQVLKTSSALDRLIQVNAESEDARKLLGGSHQEKDANVFIDEEAFSKKLDNLRKIANDVAPPTQNPYTSIGAHRDYFNENNQKNNINIRAVEIPMNFTLQAPVIEAPKTVVQLYWDGRSEPTNQEGKDSWTRNDGKIEYSAALLKEAELNGLNRSLSEHMEKVREARIELDPNMKGFYEIVTDEAKKSGVYPANVKAKLGIVDEVKAIEQTDKPLSPNDKAKSIAQDKEFKGIRFGKGAVVGL